MRNEICMTILFILFSFIIGPFTASAHGNEEHEASDSQIRSLFKGDIAPDFSLTNQAGVEMKLEDMKGKPVFITFIYTSCPDVCPIILKDLDKIADTLWWWRRRKLQHLAITVDPEVDTPAVLKQHAKDLDLDMSKVNLLTGKPETIKRVLNNYGVATFKDKETGDVGHPLFGYLVDEEGIVEEVIRLSRLINLFPQK